jgi:hypothetical protein
VRILGRMRFLPGILLVTACLGLAGCESVKTGVRDKFHGPTYQTRVFVGDSQAVFDAARRATEQLGFRITRSGPAQGVVEGVSGLASDDRFQGSRQRTIKVRLESTIGSETQVEVLFREIVEDDFNKGAGQGIETTLHNSPLYEAFFSDVSSRLAR